MAWALGCFFFGGNFLLLSVLIFRSGGWVDRTGRPVNRQTTPATFWFSVLAVGLLGIAVCGLGVLMATGVLNPDAPARSRAR